MKPHALFAGSAGTGTRDHLNRVNPGKPKKTADTGSQIHAARETSSQITEASTDQEYGTARMPDHTSEERTHAKEQPLTPRSRISLRKAGNRTPGTAGFRQPSRKLIGPPGQGRQPAPGQHSNRMSR
jgi:hypothetical protein